MGRRERGGGGGASCERSFAHLVASTAFDFFCFAKVGCLGTKLIVVADGGEKNACAKMRVSGLIFVLFLVGLFHLK